MLRLFESANHAKLYAQFRPDPPAALIKRLVDFVQEQVSLTLAVDVGCGSGQNTRCLAEQFDSVIATDISPAQIQEAQAKNKLSNVEYRSSPAEEIPVPAGSAQLVTASQCAHFFDLPRFFEAADRVLAPGGVLALYGYGFPEPYLCNKPWTEMGVVVQKAFEATESHWTHTRQEVDGKYAEDKYRLPYPGEIREEHHYQERPFSASSLLGDISTWSGFQTMVRKEGAEAGDRVLRDAEQRIRAVLSGAGDTSASSGTSRMYYFLLMARKPASP